MKTTVLYCFISLIFLTSCKKCKKTIPPDKVIISGTIYIDCYTISQNTTYYRVYPTYSYQEPEEFSTDANGMFNIEVDKSTAKSFFTISADKNPNNAFAAFYGTGENLNIGILRESANNQLVLKLKTNHVLSNLDTIKYVFQYGNFQAPIYGPILKDTIIGFYNMNITSPNSNSNVELKTLWWNFGQTTSSNQVRIDYTIHGCASVADTAYIIVP